MKKTVSKHSGTSYLLLVLTVLFFSAGVSRLGLGVAEVIAAETGPDGIGEEDQAQQQAAADEAPDLGDLFETLRAREARLMEAEAAFQARQETLREAEADLQRQLDQLLDAENQLKATLQLTETAAENDLHHLTSVFESMKPAQAAQLFMKMDVEFAAGFIARLRPEVAAEIMAGLDPVIAYAMSAVLAGRHANTPRE